MPILETIVGLSLGSLIMTGCGHVATGLAGDAVKGAVRTIKGEVLARPAGHFGLPANHEAARAIRRCQLQSIQSLLHAYRGSFNVGTAGIGALSGTGLPGGVPTVENKGNYLDERVGVHFILYPQPIGFQAEWNWGHGPQLNGARTAIEDGNLQGGYVQGMYKWDVNDWTTLIPYVR